MDFRERDFEEPFDVVQFVEDLSSQANRSHARRRRAPKDGGGGDANDNDYSSAVLLKAFEQAVEDTKALEEKTERRVDKVVKVCQEDERRHKSVVADVGTRFGMRLQHFQELEERINGIATKVVHLGDQLEGLNATRMRSERARSTMLYFSEFFSGDAPTSSIFTDATKLAKAAEVMHKLHFLCQDLPDGKFFKVKQRIAVKYVDIERELEQDFEAAHVRNDTHYMKTCADSLLPFNRGYNQCVRKFIYHCQEGAFLTGDIFGNVYTLTGQVQRIAKAVFSTADTVLIQFVQDVFERRLRNHVKKELESKTVLEDQLKTLYDLYTCTQRTALKLKDYKLAPDLGFYNRLTQSVFANLLSSYIKKEVKFLTERCRQILDEHYESIGHQRQKGGGGLRIRKPDPSAAAKPGETFLSSDVITGILSESKLALKRCEALSVSSEVANNAEEIFNVVLENLCGVYMEYAVDMALAGLPSAEPKSRPDIVLFQTIEQASQQFNLLEKHVLDCLLPLVSSSTAHGHCMRKKKTAIDQLEQKLDEGLDRALNSIVGWAKRILSDEQKKADFKPEDSGNMPLSSSKACLNVCTFLEEQRQTLFSSVDGRNRMMVMMELGTRFHRMIVDHLQQFTFNSLGGMTAICDVNEYRRTVKKFEIPLLNNLFQVLHSLCNLFIQAPAHLKQVCSEEPLSLLDKSVLLIFLQLRSDYKSSKLAKHF
ncbi:exocyst complex component 5-like [Oscarella lobularis]|uniref:exocyst complex component 5-like n=1 Tax=Oscarella lobularis TaxID=121494 RepID=UPI003313912A